MVRVRDAWRRKRPEILSGLMIAAVRLLASTWRVRHVNAEASEGLHARVVAGWHGRSMSFIAINRDTGYHLFVSPSRDGELLARVAESYGYRLIRGSTGRDGARAAVEAIRKLRADGGTLAMTPDGPRGPDRQVQDGIVAIAQRSGAPIVACAPSAHPAKFLRNWDRTMVPMPFAKVILYWDDPITLDPSLTVEEAREIVRERLAWTEIEADRLSGSSFTLERR